MDQLLEENKIIVIKHKENIIELYENNILVKVLKEVSIGENGLTDNKEEGDKCTPVGFYKIGFAFGTIENTFEHPYYQINNNHYWVDDPNSIYYNEWVEVTEKAKKLEYPYMHTVTNITWNSAEHLIDYPKQYELALVIEYNIRPKEKNRGSAIFFHVKTKETTAGCVATTIENLKYIIKWIGKSEASIFIKD